MKLDDLVGELWKDFSGYQVSNFGRVKSFHKGKVKILKPQLNQHGYLYVQLRTEKKIKPFRIHRLAAQCFIPNPEEKAQVNHIDGNKFNNHVSNLEWCTPSDNQRHAVITGLRPSGENSSLAKFTNEQVRYKLIPSA
ncbi:MAG: HNH endonuclease [Quinella sp. 1Q5]|nr:HNH endonuclease [Quinella sp. 1Q5]